MGEQHPTVGTAASGRNDEGTRVRALVACRYLVITGVLVAVVGIGGRYLSPPLLTSALGPTAYVFAAHPHSESARFRNAALGHAVAVGAGLASLSAFGLLHAPSVSTSGAPSLRQAAAAAAAAGFTVFVLEILRSHHAPAAATALLIVTGLADPGKPLIGLVLGLALVVAAGPLVGRLPVLRQPAAADERRSGS